MLLTEDRFPGFCSRGYVFDVPLDYSQPSGATVSIFAREIVSLDHSPGKIAELPWLVFLQGGPGFPSPRPESLTGWLKRAVLEYRVLLLDQRGTGLSTAVTHESLAVFSSPQAQMDYLKHFRADNIVRDCEYLRRQLCGDKPWAVLGQSFGGFCLTTYLSLAPEGLSAALITGGLPPLVDDADEVYRRTYKEVIKKNKIFYERYPGDAPKVCGIVEYLRENEVRFSSSELLSAERFLQIGLNFGFRSSGGSMNTIHYLLEELPPKALVSKLSYAFLNNVEKQLHFNTNPIYALLHEAIYCQRRASNWSAQRLMAEFAEFQPEHRPIYFTGEMIYPWMFDQYSCLKPLKQAAELLAAYDEWPQLYDHAVLRANKVPCVASIYCDDMYVSRELAEQTASRIGGLKTWITNEYEHDGLRESGEVVLDKLLLLLKS